MRNVAMFASCGFVKPEEFRKAWPIKGKESTTMVLTDEMREQIMKVHKIQMKD